MLVIDSDDKQFKLATSICIKNVANFFCVCNIALFNLPNASPNHICIFHSTSGLLVIYFDKFLFVLYRDSIIVLIHNIFVCALYD